MKNINNDNLNLLKKMGVSWFTSFAYYNRANPQHINWATVSTWPKRAKIFISTQQYHKQWLEYAANANSNKLARNTMDISPLQVKFMARLMLMHTK